MKHREPRSCSRYLFYFQFSSRLAKVSPLLAQRFVGLIRVIERLLGFEDELRTYSAKVIARSNLLHPKPNPFSTSNDYPLFIRLIDRQIEYACSERRLALPDLQQARELYVYSDYGGSESASPTYTYSILACSGEWLSNYFISMSLLREKYRIGSSEIKFSRRNRKKSLEILREMIEYANMAVQGLLVTVIMDKSIETVFGSVGNAKRELARNGYGNWNTKSAERLCRIVHISSYVIALLAKDGQRINWISDEDEILPSEAKATQSAALWRHVQSMYPNQLRTLTLSVANPEDTKMMDMLSIPDLAAGVLSSAYKSFARSEDKKMSEDAGSRTILPMLSEQGILLRRVNLRLSGGSQDYRVKLLVLKDERGFRDSQNRIPIEEIFN